MLNWFMKVYVYLFTLIIRQLVLSLETVFVLVLVCVKLVLIYYLWMFKLLWFVWNELKPKWTIIELLFRDKILPLLISCVDFSGLSASRTSSKQIFDIYWHGFWLSGWLQCALYWMCAFVLNDGNMEMLLVRHMWIISVKLCMSAGSLSVFFSDKDKCFSVNKLIGMYFEKLKKKWKNHIFFNSIHSMTFSFCRNLKSIMNEASLKKWRSRSEDVIERNSYSFKTGKYETNIIYNHCSKRLTVAGLHVYGLFVNICFFEWRFTCLYIHKCVGKGSVI